MRGGCSGFIKDVNFFMRLFKLQKNFMRSWFKSTLMSSIIIKWS